MPLYHRIFGSISPSGNTGNAFAGLYETARGLPEPDAGQLVRRGTLLILKNSPDGVGLYGDAVAQIRAAISGTGEGPAIREAYYPGFTDAELKGLLADCGEV